MTSTEGGLHFTVAFAAGHHSSERLDLSEDLALVKASLLYVDRVKLCSVGSSLLTTIAEFAESPAREQAKLVVRYLSDFQPSMSSKEVWFFEAVVGLRTRREARAVPRKTRQKILGMVSQDQDRLRRMVVDQHKASGIEGFREAVREGVHDVHTFGQTSVDALVEAHLRGGGDWLSGVDVADVLIEFMELASSAVQDGTTYPLLDAPTAEFVAAAEGYGFTQVSEAATGRGRHSGLAGDLLRRLPLLFEQATISEVLDMRRDLRVPLLGFRQAVAAFAREVRSAAWQEGFAEEADVLFHEKVEPEVERIEHAVRENSSYAEISRRVLRHGATGVMGGVVGGFLASASSLADISAAALLGGVGAPMVRALLDKHKRLRELEENQVYFYYVAREALGGGRGGRTPGRAPVGSRTRHLVKPSRKMRDA